jgi:hypothetical protein
MVFQFTEHVAMVSAKMLTDRDDIQAAYEWLEFVTDTYPDAVVEYLVQEPQHFATLEQMTPRTIRDVANRIFYSYSVIGRTVLDVGRLKQHEGYVMGSSMSIDEVEQIAKENAEGVGDG